MRLLKNGYRKRGTVNAMWREHPVTVAEHHSAIVSQNEYGVLIDLQLCADAMWNNLLEPEIRNDKRYYDNQKYRYMVWSDLEALLVGVVEKRGGKLNLTLIGYGFQEEVTIDNAVKVAAESHRS
jgi:hypothetical protein